MFCPLFRASYNPTSVHDVPYLYFNPDATEKFHNLHFFIIKTRLDDCAVEVQSDTLQLSWWQSMAMRLGGLSNSLTQSKKLVDRFPLN